jgi:hypothetical protein
VDTVSRTDIVVTATLLDVRDIDSREHRQSEGTLRVEHVVCGDVTAGQALTIRLYDGGSRLRAVGAERLWLLGRDHEGVLRPTWPAESLDELETVRRALALVPFRLHRPDRTAEGDSLMVGFTIRNTTNRDLRVSHVELGADGANREGTLRVILRRRGDPLWREESHILDLAHSESWSRLPGTWRPGESRRVDVPLRLTSGNLDHGAYRLLVRLGAGPEVQMRFSIECSRWHTIQYEPPVAAESSRALHP